jgi:outer membrane lipoprotein-sorting protein
VKKLALTAAAAAALAWTPCAPALASPAVSVDDLIARHLTARGGADKLHAITSVTMTGKMRPPGFDGDFQYAETISRPGNVRTEITLQGLTIVQAWDGRSGWQIQPFGGRKDPERLTSDDTKSLQEEADFDGALVDYKAKGNTVEYRGEEDVDGAPAYAIRVKLKNGDEQTYYLDPDAMMVIRVVTKQTLRGAEQQSITDYGDYEKVEGVYFPLEIESGPKDQPNVRQRVSIDKLVVNTQVDPSAFAFPQSNQQAAPKAPAGR